MTWYYHIRGSHVHIRVYMNGAFCGTLFLRYEEFTDVREWAADRPYLRFVEDKENKS